MKSFLNMCFAIVTALVYLFSLAWLPESEAIGVRHGNTQDGDK